jgi:Uma2 family endonuclease
MSSRANMSPITVEQYMSFRAPSGFRDELIEGEIVLSPAPKALHQEVAYRICQLLERKLEGSSFVARRRTNMQMPQDYSMPSPDVFVMDAERWWAAIAQDGYPQQSPQLVVEVISRSNIKKNVNRKVTLYLKNGGCAVWIVYLKKKMVQVLYTPVLASTSGIGETLPLPSPLPVGDLRVQDIFESVR